MTLLAAKLYDPATAVTKATTAAAAMAAIDTTNLRNAFTVPSNGSVLCRMSGVLHGATTAPQILLGVLEGATVRARVAPVVAVSNLAATSLYVAEALFVVPGLTPGAALTWDAAYGVEVGVLSTGLKFGGPNDVVASTAFGAFAFEVWTTT